MAVGRNASIIAILVLYLALASCVAARGRVGRIGRGGRGGRGGRLGPVAPVGRRGGNLETAGPGETIFNVLQYGAIPDGRKDNTQAFMKAWNAACHFDGKARLVIPPGIFLVGQVIFQGPCSGPSPIIVQVSGTVKATTDVSEYLSPEWFTFQSINGLRILGRGTFDGQGPTAWEYNDCRHNSDCHLLPTNIKFNKVTDGMIRGIHSVDSKSFHMFISNCNNFKVQGLRITAPGDSPNTDGIHVSDSSMVTIVKTVISTGDDCISIGKGTTNVSISGVTCGPGHGISIGSLGKYQNENDVNGVLVRNCTLLGTDNGIRIKTWPGSPPSQATGLVFQDIVLSNVKNPIIIDQQYCPGHCSQEPSAVKISDVHFRDIRGTSVSNVAVNLKCSERYPCENIEFFNINLKLGADELTGEPTTATCENARIGNTGGILVPPRCP